MADIRPFLAQAALAAVLLLPLKILVLRSTRMIGFALVVFGHFKAITSINYGNALGVYAASFLSAWYVVWAAVLLLAYNPRDFRRINSLPRDFKGVETSPGQAGIWESFPQSVGWKRLGWMIDVLINFRGIGMDYQAAGTSSDRKTKGSELKPFRIPSSIPGKFQFLGTQLLEFVVTYITVDFFQEVLRDIIFPYCELHPSPTCTDSSTGLKVLLQSRIFRYSIFIIADRAAFSCIHAAMALISVGICTDSVLGAAGQPWTHPPLFGSPMALVKSGLRGYWGVFWHDLFKEGFQSCATLLLGLNSSKAAQNRLLHTFVVFLLSGYVHAAASWSVHRTLAIAYRPFLFFILQPLGIALQSMLLSLGSRWARKGAINAGVLRLFLAISSAAWLHWVFPLLIDDLVWGGVVDRMRVPFSVIKWLRDMHSRQ